MSHESPLQLLRAVCRKPGSRTCDLQASLVLSTIVVSKRFRPDSRLTLRRTDLEFHVLLALGDGPSHGYAIGQYIDAQSGGRLDPTTGALYQTLRRLTDQGLVEPADGPGGADARRKYFAL